ncbi:MAG: primosomal protein N' [Parcubacteria group bacterium]|jgi:primosomal protein N' (replication factor Y)
MRDKRYIIQVIPLIRLPLMRTQAFSYYNPEILPAGSLVKVSFFRQNVLGIVVGIRDDFEHKGTIRIKNIGEVIEKSFLTEKQLALANYVAEKYICPPGIVLKGMIPSQFKMRAKKGSAQTLKGKNIITKSAIAEKISKDKSKYFVLDGSGTEREAVNLALIGELVKTKKQCLILVPEIYFSHGIYEKIKTNFPEQEIALFHSKMAKGKQNEWREKVKEGKLKVIIASRAGIFLPFKSLGLVIVREPQEASFKQWDTAPRYNAADSARFLADQYGAKLIFESFMPSVKLFKKIEDREYMRISCSQTGKEKRKIEIVDMYPEKKSADLPISKNLYSGLAKSIEDKKQALLLVNRRGFSTFSICQSCKKVLSCPKCDKALVYFDEKSQYVCLHCGYKRDLLSSCPSCGGFQFSHYGVGSQTVEKKLKKLFPFIKIGRLDSDTIKSQSRLKKLYADLFGKKIDILTGTQIALESMESGSFSLVGIISAYDFFGKPDYNSRETAFFNLGRARELVGSQGVLIIQAPSLNDPLFKYLESGKSEDFLKDELKLRKKYAYPPYSQIIKLSYADHLQKKAESESARVFDLLNVKSHNNIRIEDPFAPYLAKKRGKFTINILIKISGKEVIADTPIYAIMSSLGKGWKIDVDPISTV